MTMPTDPGLAALIAAADSLAVLAARRRTAARYAAARGEVRRILDATLELMRANPADEVRIADVVRGAGLSNDAFYRTFRGKGELMAALADDATRQLLADVAQQANEHTDTVEQVRACVRTVLRQAADPEVAATTRAVLRHAPRARGAQDAAQLQTGLAELLGGLAVPEPLIAAGAIIALMEHYLWAERQPPHDAVDRLVSWVLPR
jgi:AcrR family transcriptional regulator